MSTKSLPQIVLDELEACEQALAYWRLRNADSVAYPPGLQKWRDRMAELLDQYWPENPRQRVWQGVDDGFGKPIMHFMTLPARRRPTLSEYDNRRTQHVDQYSYGIYVGKYS